MRNGILFFFFKKKMLLKITSRQKGIGEITHRVYELIAVKTLSDGEKIQAVPIPVVRSTATTRQ